MQARACRSIYTRAFRPAQVRPVAESERRAFFRIEDAAASSRGASAAAATAPEAEAPALIIFTSGSAACAIVSAAPLPFHQQISGSAFQAHQHVWCLLRVGASNRAGTTGRPKGVVLTHGNLQAHTTSLVQACPLCNWGRRTFSELASLHKSRLRRSTTHHLPPRPRHGSGRRTTASCTSYPCTICTGWATSSCARCGAARRWRSRRRPQRRSGRTH